MESYWSVMSWPLSLLLYLAAGAVGFAWTAAAYCVGVASHPANTRVARGLRRAAVAVARWVRRREEEQTPA